MKKHRYFMICVVLICCLLSCNVCQAGKTAGFSIKGTTLLTYSGSSNAVTVPKKVTMIGKKAFAANKSIKKVTIQKGVTKIKSAAFKNCSKLKTITLPVSVKKIASNAFSGCKNLTIAAPKGSYALKFAKKHKISWKKTNVKQDNDNSQPEEVSSFYSITDIICYWYTAGTYPCIAEKKIVADSTGFDRIYETLLLLNSGEPAGEEDQIAGGKTLRVIIDFSDKESRIIECNAGVYAENGTSNKLAEGASAADFWNSIEGDILEETL